jgi:hypothetical protein
MHARHPAGPAHEDPAFPAFLDEVMVAMLGRDGPAIRRLMAHPLSRGLPRVVHEEALVVTRAPDSLRAPIQTLGFFHRMSQLLNGEPSRRTLDLAGSGWLTEEPCEEDAAERDHDDGSPPEPDPWQMELFEASG